MLRLSLGKSIRKTFQWVRRVRWPGAHLLAAPSSLLLLHFKFDTVSIGVSSGVTGLALAFFLALVMVRTGWSVMWAGIGAVTDFSMNIGVVAGVFFFRRGSRGGLGFILHLYWRLLLLLRYFGPFCVHFYLGVLRLLLGSLSFAADGGRGSCCCCSLCGGCGSCSIWWVLPRTELRNMSQQLAAPTARSSAFHDHHHLPHPANNYLRDGLEALPSQTKPEHVVPVGRPAADLNRLISTTRQKALRKATSTSPVINTGMLQILTLILRVPRYSGCSRKNFVMVLLDATFSACSAEESKTSYVAKLPLQKYWHGTSAFRRRSTKLSFFKPTSRLVFMSDTTKETILGSSLWRISGIGKISFPLKYSAYLPTRSFSYSFGALCLIFHGDACWLTALGICPGWIGLPGSVGSDGQLDSIRLTQIYLVLRTASGGGFISCIFCIWRLFIRASKMRQRWKPLWLQNSNQEGQRDLRWRN